MENQRRRRRTRRKSSILTIHWNLEEQQQLFALACPCPSIPRTPPFLVLICLACPCPPSLELHHSWSLFALHAHALHP